MSASYGNDRRAIGTKATARRAVPPSQSARGVPAVANAVPQIVLVGAEEAYFADSAVRTSAASERPRPRSSYQCASAS
jgi:hypothetical protein